jgi:hypothetical protein
MNRMTMTKKIFALLSLIGLSTNAARAAEPRHIARIAVLASGELRLDGRAITLDELDRALAKLPEDGVIWYFRENPLEEPTAQALATLEHLMDRRLPISFSSKADYSDYIDDRGLAHPRKP